MQLLSRPLGSIRIGRDFPAEALLVMVAVGLFPDGVGRRLAGCFPDSVPLLADGEGWQINRRQLWA